MLWIVSVQKVYFWGSGLTRSSRGIARNLFWGGIRVFWGGIKSSITILTSLLPHKKFTWSDFGRVYIPHIPPCRYAPAEYLKKMGNFSGNCYVKFGHFRAKIMYNLGILLINIGFRYFDNFSGKNHVKFRHFVNFSHIFFGQKCLAP